MVVFHLWEAWALWLIHKLSLVLNWLALVYYNFLHWLFSIFKFFQKISDTFFRINNIIEVSIRLYRNVFRFKRIFQKYLNWFQITVFIKSPVSSIEYCVLTLHWVFIKSVPLSAFWITRLFSFFNLHSDSIHPCLSWKARSCIC